MPKKLQEIIELALSCMFYGEITIRFQAGKITQVERKESIKM